MINSIGKKMFINSFLRIITNLWPSCKIFYSDLCQKIFSCSNSIIENTKKWCEMFSKLTTQTKKH